MPRLSALKHFRPFARLLRSLTLMVAALLSASPMFAATFTVNSTSDQVDANLGDGSCFSVSAACTLRAAIQEANALQGDDEVVLPAGIFELSILGANEDASVTGDLDLFAPSEGVTVRGAGTTSTIIDGQNADNVFHLVYYGARLTLSDLTVRNAVAGVRTDTPGALPATVSTDRVTFSGNATALAFLQSNGSVTDCTFVQNQKAISTNSHHKTIVVNSDFHSNDRALEAYPETHGFEVYDSRFTGNGSVFGDPGVFKFTNSVMSGNTALGNCVYPYSILTISACTMIDNGGGIDIDGGCSFLMRNSLYANNAGSIRVGGSYHPSPPTIHNSTLADNDAPAIATMPYYPSGPFNLDHVTITGNLGGISANDDGEGEVTMVNTIVAGNLGFDCSGAVSLGHNLIQSPSDCTTVSSDLLGQDPNLGPLQSNGGPTFTRALLSGSPAIDAADACTTPDQRGTSRPQGAACDIGAYEFACGNGAMDLGESCDDGNTLDGDCCSANCQLDPAGSLCTDGNACTTEACDGEGVCAPGSPVDCGACQTCESESGCVANVLTSCRQPTESFSGQLVFLNGSNPKLRWQWTKGHATDIGDFGDPFVGDRYSLCLFDESSPAPQLAFRATTRAGLCGGKPCWRTAGASSFKYKDREQTPDGLDSALLKSGPDGKAKVLVSGKGENLTLPTLPLSLPVRMQLQAENGQCWEAQYFEVGVSRNDGTQFKAKGYLP